MKRLLFILLGCVTYAQLQLVAITHPNCPVCKKWHDEVLPNYVNEAKRNHYPLIQVYNISDPKGRDFVRDKIGYITAIPFFVIIDEKVISKFEGYSDYKSFYEDLDTALKRAPRDGLEPPTK